MKSILTVLFVALAVLAFSVSTNRVVTGKITESSGRPVPFASVLIKESHRGVLSDANGEYSIRVNDNDVLIFSAASYTSVEIKVGTRNLINVTLQSGNDKASEVIVVSAFSTKKMARSTASNVQNISAHDLNTVRQSNINNALAGKAAGVKIGSQSSFGSPNIFNEDGSDTEDYDAIVENGFKQVRQDPVSTFSIDVDPASYSNIRRFLNNGQLPPAGSVRTEEMINYFKYKYDQPKDEHPFSIYTESGACPWNEKHKLVLIGLQGKNIPVENLPASNLVFLVDVSGSMEDENKLPLVKSSLKLLVEKLREEDRISLVVYAGRAGLVLPSTAGNRKREIIEAIDRLSAGGSTAGGAGLELAYKVAVENFKKEGNNRVILCTDGDFNVGQSSDAAMVKLIEAKRNSGVFLTVLGYGMGNYKDNKMQQLANKGNGNHAYIDGIQEARKVLVQEFGGTLHTIAKDVKLQLEFNPARVSAYRLIGYENRMLNKEDFNDDKKDAGEIGSGHTVTAIYEIIPAGVSSLFIKPTDILRYQSKLQFEKNKVTDGLLTVKFRYKEPKGSSSKLLIKHVKENNLPWSSVSENYRFAAAVAEFGMILRGSEFKGNSSYSSVLNIANNSLNYDPEDYRKSFIELVKKAQEITNSKVSR